MKTSKKRDGWSRVPAAFVERLMVNHPVWSVIAIAIISVGIYYFILWRKCPTNVALSVSTLFAFLALMFLFFLRLGYKYEESEGEQFREHLSTLILAILVALMLLLNKHGIRIRELLSNPGDDLSQIDIAKQIGDILLGEVAEAAIISLVLFAVGLVARSAQLAASAARHSQDIKISADKYEKSAVEYERGAQEHRYAGLAAKALGLRSWEVIRKGPSDDPDTKLIDAGDAGIDALTTWIERGSNLTHDRSDHSCSRDLWWKIMRIYEREEVYDLSRYELATNVRNYAFILAGVIAEVLEHTKNKDSRKLVVFNCTPFAPKDFYNYPDGVPDRRFYHEMEFFGTYRRLLREFSQHPKVEMYRILLTDAKSEDDYSQEAPKNISVGWPLDPIWDIVRDCAHFSVLPAAIPLSIKNSRELRVRSPRLDPDLARLLAPNFPPEHDPRASLDNHRDFFLWIPFFVDLLKHDTTNATEFWHSRPLKFEKEATGITGDLRNDPAEWRLSIARRKTGEIANVVTKILKQEHDQYWNWVQVTKQWLFENKALQPYDGDLQLLKNDFDQLYTISAEILGDTPPGPQKRASVIAKLLNFSQSFDAKTALLKSYLNPGQGPSIGEHSRLGIAEEWLHRFLLLEEWKSLRGRFVDKGPIPIWEAFFADCLLGRSPGEREELSDYLDLAKKHLRVVPIADKATTNNADTQVTAEDLRSRGILPEFLLIGERDDADPNGTPAPGLLDKVEWRALVATSMSHPFHTCRIVTGFTDSKLLRNHTTWVVEMFDSSETKKTTADFFNTLKDQILSKFRLDGGS